MMEVTCNVAKKGIAILWTFTHLFWYFFNGCKCQTPGDIRLVGGSIPLEGRVEVYYGGQWGTICDDFWDDEDATVVCRQLGFFDNGTAVLQAAFGVGTGPIWMDNVKCNGTENKLQNCNYRGWGTHNCDHKEDASVACNIRDGDLRLAGGVSSTEGRVEVFHDGQWGRVCSRSWGIHEAEVVCRQVGFNASGTSYVGTRFGAGSGPFWLSFVRCAGNEDSLQNCTHRRWGMGTEKCGDHYVAGVHCNLVDKKTEFQEIRLVGGSTPNEGRVEMYYERYRTWSTVCDNGWDDKDAVVVCRQLGFNTGGTAVGRSAFGDGTGTIYRSGIGCTGEEEKVSDCRNAEYRPGSYCDHTEDAGVRCNDVRLKYGQNLHEGRLEVFHDGEWGTVCDESWDDVDAGVVCRQLGFGQKGTAIRRSFFGSTTRLRLHDIDCTGTEASILDCHNSGWSEEKCNSLDNIGVSCIEEHEDIPFIFLITIAVMFALLLGIIFILVCLVMWIRKIKLSSASNVNGLPTSIEMYEGSTSTPFKVRFGNQKSYMRPNEMESTAVYRNNEYDRSYEYGGNDGYVRSDEYDNPPNDHPDEFYENNQFH